MQLPFLPTALSISHSVCQVEHPAARHDASLFPHRQRVFALRCNLPAHAHVWTLCVRRLAPGLRHGTPLRRAPRPHRGREYMTPTHCLTLTPKMWQEGSACASWTLEVPPWHLEHNRKLLPKTRQKQNKYKHEKWFTFSKSNLKHWPFTKCSIRQK